MKKYYSIMIGLSLAMCIMISCKKSAYFIDGGTIDGHVNMTTYDYLKTNAKFDTLRLIIDKAGMQSAVNGNVTFFASTNFSIKNYLVKKEKEWQVKHNNENLKFTIDSLFKYYSAGMLRDSLSIYILPGQITRDNLTKTPSPYPTLLSGTQMYVSLEGYDKVGIGGINDIPKYIYFTKVVGALDPINSAGQQGGEQNDIRERCQTTGIITTTGILHVLQNSHVYSFRR